MPMKNASKYLEDCLKSILLQSYEDWELCIADDHSNDESWSIAKHYSTLDSKIHLISNQGHGIIDALKTAYEFSQGEFITRMDADDIMPENKLERYYGELESNSDLQVISSKVKYFSNQEVSPGYLKYENWLNEFPAKEFPFHDIYRECIIASPAWMIRREDFEKCGAFHSENYPEDYDLIFRFYAMGYKIKYLDEVLHYWREHPERTSRNSDNYDQLSFYQLKWNYFLKLDHNNGHQIVCLASGIKAKLMNSLMLRSNVDYEIISESQGSKKDILNRIIEIIQNKDADIEFLICFANSDEQRELVNLFYKWDLKLHKDFFLFS